MPSERRLNGLQGIMHLHVNIDGSEYNWCGHCENMNAIMGERYTNGWEIRAEWHDSHIGMPVCRTAWFKNNNTAVTCRSWFIFNDSRTLLSAGCEHAGIMQRTDDKGRMSHMPCSRSREFPAACRSLKLTPVLPACFQVNQVRMSFYGMISYEHRNADFDSDGDFMCFMRNASKTGFSVILIKTLVHRAQNIRLCGRHRFSAFNRFAISCWDRALISLTPIFTDSQYGNTSSSYWSAH